LAHESGSSVRGRAQIGHGGHARLRTARYLATRTAARCNPMITAYYERLRAAGKPNKVARWAAARKLLHLAWAVVTKRHPVDPAYRTRMVAERPAAEAADRGGRLRNGGAAPRTNTCSKLATTQWHGHDRLPQRWSVVRLVVGRLQQVAEGARNCLSNSCLTTITVSYFVGPLATAR
jgi:hypothetical protein